MLHAYRSMGSFLESLGIGSAANKNVQLQDILVGEVTRTREGTWFEWFLQVTVPDGMADRGTGDRFGLTFHFDEKHASYFTISYFGLKNNWWMQTNCYDKRIADELGITAQECLERRISEDQAKELVRRAASHHLSKYGPNY
ncbi:MAG: hypothetical protein ABH820_04185 [Patescibacteria group bacterium]